MKTGVFKIVAAVSALALFAGCGGSSSESSAAGSAQSGKEVPKSYVISSGNSGGTYYYIAAGQAKILSEKLKDYSFTTESTSGSPVENLTFTSENISTLGFTTLDGLYAAVKGDTTKGFRQAIDNVALIQAGHTLILYCITLSSSGIQTIYDLKGKKISVPTIGNTAYYQAVGILEQYGIALDDVRATPMLYAEAADALKDGSLDAIFIAGGIPQSAVTDLDTTKNIKFLNIEREKVDSVLKAYPYWGIKAIPANTYKHQPEDLNVMTATVTLAANLGLDEEVVYQITKTLNESTEELGIIHQDGKYWNVDTTRNVIDMGIVPIHPGAKRYYDEVSKK